MRRSLGRGITSGFLLAAKAAMGLALNVISSFENLDVPTLQIYPVFKAKGKSGKASRYCSLYPAG